LMNWLHWLDLIIRKKEIVGIFDSSSKTLAPALASDQIKLFKPALAKLGKQLEPIVFLVNNNLSVVDLVIFCHLSSTVKKWTDDEAQSTETNATICRWYDNIQHLKQIRDTVFDLDLFVPIKLPSIVISEQANTQSELKSPSITIPLSSENILKPQKEEPPPQPAKKEEQPAKKEEQPSKKGAPVVKKEAQVAKKEAPASKKEAAKKNPSAPKAAEQIGFAKLDFRVGKIVSVVKHPNADALYLEQIDVGEGHNRTVVSGLVNFVPIQQMQDRIVIIMCNLKPSKMRGENSQAMVMCASNGDHTIVEPLLPPEGSEIGDRVVVDGEEGAIEENISLANKNNIFSTILQPDLKTNDEGVATYKGKPLHTAKGIIRSNVNNAQLS